MVSLVSHVTPELITPVVWVTTKNLLSGHALLYGHLTDAR